ncbi:MAG: P-loop NTPase, partial [Proteobacteria bacterium]|nr:P-loop NTPase [Pseudomonadota bacterium]
RKGIEMFRKVEVPVIGVVENMSTHVCSQCGHEEPVFGEGGGDAVARDYETELLGQLPLSMQIRQRSDEGTPVVRADPGSAAATTFLAIAARVRSAVESSQTAGPVIRILDD